MSKISVLLNAIIKAFQASVDVYSKMDEKEEEDMLITSKKIWSDTDGPH